MDRTTTRHGWHSLARERRRQRRVEARRHELRDLEVQQRLLQHLR